MPKVSASVRAALRSLPGVHVIDVKPRVIVGFDVYEAITDAAAKHADESGEPDHEVGDLQEALQVAIETMPPDVLAAYVKAMNLNLKEH